MNYFVLNEVFNISNDFYEEFQEGNLIVWREFERLVVFRGKALVLWQFMKNHKKVKPGSSIQN